MLMARHSTRRLPVGAEPTVEGVAFRVWAPEHRKVTIVFENGRGRGKTDFELEPEPGGYYSGVSQVAAPGMNYWLRLEGARALLPHPAARVQPSGPNGPAH